MNGAVSLLRTAAQAGVEVCFANPGTTEMPLVAALDTVPDVRAILGIFEGVCTGAADGYGRMTGRPALTLLHLGPGFANGIANLHNARRAHTPVVNLIGDHASWHRRFDAPLTSDIESLARPVSGWLHTTSSAKRLADDVAEAIAAATGPPGQVATLIIPADHQWEEGAGLVAVRTPDAPTQVTSGRLEQIASQLRSADDPVILLGGRALDASGQRAAARIASVTGSRLLAETFPARWERGAGLPTVKRLAYFPEQAVAELADAEVVLLAGARDPVAFFGYPDGVSRVVPPDRVVSLGDDGDDLDSALWALADAVGASPTLVVREPSERPPDPPTSGALDPASVAAVLAALLPEDAIVVEEAATSGLPFYAASEAAPRHSTLTLTGGAIGQGPPCATGAAVACPDRKVIDFQADGSSLYTIQALWTQARESLDVVTLLCSNRAYRILQVELARSGVAEPGPAARSLTHLEQPEIDWISLARGFGVPGTRCESVESLTPALRGALEESGPHLIELVL